MYRIRTIFLCVGIISPTFDLRCAHDTPHGEKPTEITHVVLEEVHSPSIEPAAEEFDFDVEIQIPTRPKDLKPQSLLSRIHLLARQIGFNVMWKYYIAKDWVCNAFSGIWTQSK